MQLLVSDEFGVIPASTRLQVALATASGADNKVMMYLYSIYSFYIKYSKQYEHQLCIELSVCTNNDTIIKALIMFSEGIFDGETLIAYSYHQPKPRIILPFITPKNIAYDIHLKVCSMAFMI